MSKIVIDKKIKSVRLGDAPKIVDELPVIVTDVKLPSDAQARLVTLKAEGKKWYLTVAYHPESDRPFALFCHTNHIEKTAQTSDAIERLVGLARSEGILKEHVDDLESKIDKDPNVAKLTRVISLLLRHRVSIKKIVRTLDQMDTIYAGSFLFQIKKFLSQYIKDGELVEGGTCSDCGSSNLVYSSGCMTCVDCGGSKCG
jgi:hypothetical protein